MRQWDSWKAYALELQARLVKHEGGSPMVLNALTAGQYAAILDFAYNLGVGAFAASTLCHFIQIGNMAAVPGQFALWTHERVNGVETVEQGLVRRRAAEVDVWNSPAPA